MWGGGGNRRGGLRRCAPLDDGQRRMGEVGWNAAALRADRFSDAVVVSKAVAEPPHSKSSWAACFAGVGATCSLVESKPAPFAGRKGAKSAAPGNSDFAATRTCAPLGAASHQELGKLLQVIGAGAVEFQFF